MHACMHACMHAPHAHGSCVGTPALCAAQLPARVRRLCVRARRRPIALRCSAGGGQAGAAACAHTLSAGLGATGARRGGRGSSKDKLSSRPSSMLPAVVAVTWLEQWRPARLSRGWCNSHQPIGFLKLAVELRGRVLAGLTCEVLGPSTRPCTRPLVECGWQQRVVCAGVYTGHSTNLLPLSCHALAAVLAVAQQHWVAIPRKATKNLAAVWLCSTICDVQRFIFLSSVPPCPASLSTTIILHGCNGARITVL